MTNRPTNGRFCWYDIATANPEQTVEFYTQLFGWTTRTQNMGDFDYTMFARGGNDFAGVMPIDTTKGQQPAWVSYVTVNDITAAANTAETHGGRFLMPITDIPNVGKFFTVQDPQGAVICPFQAASEMPEREGMPGVGEVCWTELGTSDLAGAQRFYTALFGWQFKPGENMPDYTIGHRGDVMELGAMSLPDGVPHPYWLNYVAVENLDESAAKATSLGGMIVMGPMAVPNMGRFSVCRAPDGTFVGLFEGA